MALDLSLEPGQQMLRDGLRRFLADNAWPGWRSLSDALGLGGVAVPEGAGGFGGGMRDIALVMGELAPAHAGADWLSHAVASWLLRSEEHTSELQSLMRISYAVFCLKKKNLMIKQTKQRKDQNQ